MNKNNKWLYGIGIFTVIFLIISIVFRNLEVTELPIQVSGVLFEVVVTAIITVLLLNGQSASEEKRDRSLLVFEKKQEVYHNFLENLKKIIMDGEITINANREVSGDTIDELKDLLFELGYVQLHTSEKNTEAIFKKVTEIIQVLNDFEQEGVTKQKLLPQFYSQISAHLFEIISILKQDLYGISANTIKEGSVKELLESCDLFVDTKEFDRYELQNYFWQELQNQFIKLGYPVKIKDFTADVHQFYARARNRHRYYGIQFPVYPFDDGTSINFKIELENELYYGFIRAAENEENKFLEQAVSSIGGFNSSAWWFGWKWFDRYPLNFWSCDSSAFALLKNPRKRERLIREIAGEMDMYIKKLQNTLNELGNEKNGI